METVMIHKLTGFHSKSALHATFLQYKNNCLSPSSTAIVQDRLFVLAGTNPTSCPSSFTYT